MLNRKVIISIIVVGLTVTLVLTLWQLPIFLIFGLLATAFIKHKYAPIKKEFLMFVSSAIIGSLGESLVMLNGPWSYASCQIFNFPLWLPFLWGLTGITGISIYESISTSGDEI